MPMRLVQGPGFVQDLVSQQWLAVLFFMWVDFTRKLDSDVLGF